MPRTTRLPLIPLVCGAVLATALTGVGGQHGADAAVSPVSAAAKPKVRAHIQVATLNTAASMSAKRALEDIESLAATGPDVIALQEMGSGKRRSRMQERLVECEACGYGSYVPTPAVPGSTPILFRWDRFDLIGKGTQQVSEATYVGPRGAGPSTLRAKFVNWVQLKERTTGRELYVLNNHAVPTVQAPGGGPNRRQPKRLALYRKHMNGLKSLVTGFRSTGASVVVTGDLNVNYRKDKLVRARLFPYTNLGSVGIRSSYQVLGEPVRGTHELPNGTDTRLIDYVAYSPQRGIKAVDQRVLRGYHSDHRPVVVQLRLTR
jgi:endonuclease/exonuclease/phosphatase family metal-dependent hydrolase